ncbi:Uroporphyrinogen decarboxylase [Moorella thermoacetica]|uniref:uroporphyrinogen decarboxylase family protein n=1 Tax=Neomoorella thermoacetica TaxID=1525 RepID=UPI0030D3D43C
MKNINHDEMTPNERRQALAQGRPVDRIPCVPKIGNVAARYIGVHVRDMLASAELTAAAQIQAYQLLHHDAVGVCLGMHPLARALGGTMTNPLDDNPAMLQSPVKDEKDLERLDLAALDRDKFIQTTLTAARILQDKVGKEVTPGVVIGGPFTVAASLRGTEFLLRDVIRNPEFAHRVISFALQAIIHVVIPFIKEGIIPAIVDPVASGSVLNVKKAWEFAFSYTQKLIDEFKKYTPGVSLHVCGKTTRLLEMMAATGASSLSLDNSVDLLEAKRLVGHRVALSGNVDPVNVMALGNPETVRLAVKDCLQRAWDTPRGYILAAGCDLPLTTPLENIAALVEAARIYGRWPLDPRNFA